MPPMRFHGKWQESRRLFADGAETHRAGGEALDDFLGRFDLIEAEWLFRAYFSLSRPRKCRHVAVSDHR